MSFLFYFFFVRVKKVYISKTIFLEQIKYEISMSKTHLETFFVMLTVLILFHFSLENQ